MKVGQYAAKRVNSLTQNISISLMCQVLEHIILHTFLQRQNTYGIVDFYYICIKNNS